MWRERGIAERSLDHHARLARRFLDVDTSTVSLLESDRQVLPGAAGLRAPYDELRETPLTHSFCRYVVADGLPLVVADAREVPRLAHCPAILEMGVIAYAGWPLHDAAGRTIGSLCAFSSVPREWSDQDLAVLEDLATACSAELQHALALAEETESLTRAVFDAAPVAMAFFDDQLQAVLVNELAERTLTRPHEPLLARALRQELDEQPMEWIGPPGRQSAVIVSSRRVQRADRSRWGTLVAAQDVTALARALAVKDEFIATVSHELRTPLTSVRACAELLGDELGETAPHVRQILDRLQRASDNLNRRIEQLLCMGERRKELAPEPTDLSLLARLMPITFAEQAARRDVRLRVDGDVPQWAAVDPRRIEQALENLVSNALKYTSPGGHVVISLRGDEDEVELQVADDGVGMDGDEVDQAFDLFWRAERSRRTAVQGLGLGLTLVRDIATEHHGTVELTSVPGAGTRVVLRLPRGAAGRC